MKILSRTFLDNQSQLTVSGMMSRQGRTSGVIECWYTKAESDVKTGSFGLPFNRTPRIVGSTRKCRTSSSLFGPLDCTPGGGWATLTTRPYALAKVVESRTTNVPGGAFRSKAIASSRLMFGLYQYLDESRANLTNCGATSCGSLVALDVVELRRDV